MCTAFPTWGTVGITYNKEMVDKADLAQELGASVEPQICRSDPAVQHQPGQLRHCAENHGAEHNPSSTQDIEDALVKLQEQKPLVQAYVMDEVFDKMEGGEAAIAPYFAGDGLTMTADNPNLGMFIPPEGTIQYVDAMCIPASSQNPEAAEMFINYLCEVDVALQNALFIQYTSPVSAVRELPGPPNWQRVS